MLAYKGWCKGCGEGGSISSITIPYAAKLLIQEVSFGGCCCVVCSWEERGEEARGGDSEEFCESDFRGSCV